ncbi:hypothetical protein QNO07_26730 [Streptomyces sp. 549]|uniref:hypothetical protein n=1 Tax=Streptomyces sp. 549 TaxID=3049076 RepID=UPI0024C2EEBF|nr:hypothetical protein [Streptomyces sp. 549]MDK1476947.1 hypothetical protein [Streptomyces sp. 549]
MDATEPHGGGVGAEFVDGLGEALGVQAGGFTVGAGLIHALAAVGDDQGDERAGPGHHPEGQLHQVEQRVGVELRRTVDLAEVQQHHQPMEDTTGDQHRRGEGDGQRPTDPPQTQLPVVRGRSRPSVRCHAEGDKNR